jgi:hypothetical protein
MTKNWKNLQLKKTKIFCKQIAIYLSLGLRKGQEKSSSLEREHLSLCGSFSPTWIRIRNPNPDRIQPIKINPDPADKINADPGPDPQHWLNGY